MKTAAGEALATGPEHGGEATARIDRLAPPSLGGDALPSMGRIVLYTLPEHERGTSGAGRTFPAIVTGYTECTTGDLVNVRVFFDGPPQGDEWRPVVPRAHQPGTPGTWAWPRRAPDV